MYELSLGTLTWTRGVHVSICEDDKFACFVLDSLRRHAHFDWGDLSDDDKRENDYSLDKHLRILSAYQQGDWKIWIITEADRSATTILFPDEY